MTHNFFPLKFTKTTIKKINFKDRYVLVFVKISYYHKTCHIYSVDLSQFHINSKIVSEYDQEIPQSQTADKPVVS